MEVAKTAGLLLEKANELYRSLDIAWRYPKSKPSNPLKATIRSSYAIWTPGDTSVLRKNDDNWFYADVEFPESHCGVDLAGTEGWFIIHGWCPFTLWLDGAECFKETHSWHATGPIADPVIAKIEPGRTYRLIMCCKPTELPAGFNPVAVGVHSKECFELGAQLGAAGAQLRIAEALASGDDERRLVAQAASKIDEAALKANRWERAKASIAEMESALQPLSARAKAITLHVIGHTHIDMDWMWTWKDTVYCARRDFKATTAMQDDFPELTFTHSQVPTYDVVRKMDPSVFAKVKERIREGRWENAAGTWVEGDLNMADGESIARHMLYAAQWTREHLDSKAKVLWEPDTFGHPGNMPQLAKLGEHDCYFHWRCNPGAEQNWPARIWEGVDGTTIHAFSTCYGSGLLAEHILGNTLDALRFNLKNAFHIWGLGDHGGGLPRFHLELLEHYRSKPLIPAIRFSTMRAYMAAVEAEGTPLPRNKGMTWSLFEGCFTTHARMKKYNRLCEGALLTAEALGSLAGLENRDKLREGWTTMLFNHFHDIADGAAVHDTYIDAFERAEASLKIARRLTADAAAILAQQAKNGKTLVVLNQLGFERTEPVAVALPKSTKCLLDADGAAVPVQRKGDEFIFIAENVPAFSSRAYQIRSDEAEGLDETPVAVAEDAQFYRIETPLLKSALNRESGAIGSCFDKSLARELVAYGVPKHLTHVPTTRADLALNVFQVIDEAPNGMSAWLINDILRQENLLRKAEVTLLDAGPVFARFKVMHVFRNSTVEEQVIYYRKLRRIDFVADIDWRERGSAVGPAVGPNETGVPQLKVSFATSMNAPAARFEGPFFVNEQPPDGIEMPTQKWADVSGDAFGFALLNDSKYGCDVLGGRIRITLLRNPYGPDPEPDNGRHSVRFAFEPHGPGASNAQLIRAGMSFNRLMLPLFSEQPVKAAAPRLRIEGADSVVCTGLRIAEHSAKTVLRLFETAGRGCRARVWFGSGPSSVRGIASAEEVNFLENPTGGQPAIEDGAAVVDFHPFEVKTLLIEQRR